MLCAHTFYINHSTGILTDDLSPLISGELVEFIKEHPDEKYEEWWEAKNEDGEIGYVPSTYVIVKREIVRVLN